jgi:anionic cell wall polymer biosynthesis LytR-Cps2A-Psr (LCP) family protein
MGKAIAGKLLYGVVCLAAAVLLVVAGYAHKVVGQTTELGQGIPISNSPTVGAMNILVMGLESRTNYEGQTLPNSLLTAMHAGSASAVAAGQLGSQDTNTLILIHIFAGGQKAVGFSIPRDDLVTYPHTYDGQTEGKIDGAYAYAYTQYLSANQGKESSSNLYLHANQAGQTATVDTVQSVTGQHIDHFAEVNLAGFYYLAVAFGGIEVCIAPAPKSVEPSGLAAGANLTDSDPLTGTDNSGFNAYLDGYNRTTGGPQYLHLSAPQALAFVRSRDTLPGIDLGRTKRQQATIDYVIYELKHEGAFTAVGKLDSLLSTADQYLITDAHWNLLDFATDMSALSGQHLSFQTLPFTPENGVSVPGYPGLQDVNIINLPAIKQLVNNAFNPQAAVTQPTGADTTTGPTVTGTAPPGTAGTTGPATQGAQGAQGTQATGAQVIGAAQAASTTATPSPSATTGTGSGGVGSSGTGGTVTVAPNAPYGIPCVY